MSRWSIRPARFEDATFVYALSQEPSVLRWRVRQEPFTFEQHLQWWMNEASFFAAFNIAIDETNEPIGYSSLHDGEVSVAVHPNDRREGVGSMLLKGLTGTALILPENEPSIRLFEKCGYTKTGTETRNGKEWMVYVK